MDKDDECHLKEVFGAFAGGVMITFVTMLLITMPSCEERNKLKQEALDRGFAHYEHLPNGEPKFTWVSKAEKEGQK